MCVQVVDLGIVQWLYCQFSVVIVGSSVDGGQVLGWVDCGNYWWFYWWCVVDVCGKGQVDCDQCDWMKWEY